MCRQALLIPLRLSCSDFRVDAVEPRKCTVSAGSYGAEASTAPAALMDCWTFMCTVCNVCRSDGGDQLVKVNRVKQTNKSVRLTEVVRALPVPTILHAPHVTAPLRDVWSARPGDGKDRMLHDEAFRSFSSMYVLGLCNRRRCLGVCWGRESSRELKVLALLAHPLYVGDLSSVTTISGASKQGVVFLLSAPVPAPQRRTIQHGARSAREYDIFCTTSK